MRFTVVAGLASALAVSAFSASAETHLGWYVAADAGRSRIDGELKVRDVTQVSSYGSWLPPGYQEPIPDGPVRNDVYREASEFSGSGRDINPDAGGAGFIRFGNQLSTHWRVELELGSRVGRISPIRGQNDQVITGTGGSIGVGTNIVNLLYDIAPEHRLHGFVGAGAGLASLRGYAGQHYAYQTPLSTGLPPFLPPAVTSGTYSENIAFLTKSHAGAFQWLAGAVWSLSPGVNLDITYRNLTVAGARQAVDIDTRSTLLHIQCFNCANVQPGQTVSQYQGRANLRVHDESVTIGLRWSLGGTKP